MKKSDLKKFAMMIAMVMMSAMGLTSCEGPYDDWGWDRGGSGRWVNPDKEVSYAIDGCWRGYMNFYHPWEGRQYTTTEIEFVPNSPNATYGKGYWVDYYDNYSETYYVFNNIEWEVVNGELDVHFIEENTWVAFTDYTITDNYFDGYINDNGNLVSFRLNRVDGPYWGNWTIYVYYDWSTYVMSKGKKATANTQEFLPRKIQ